MGTKAWSLPVLALLLCGCDTSPSVEESLDIDPGDTPLHIDTNCANGGCGAQEDLAFTVGFDPGELYHADTAVEFLQYRVDYVLAGVDDVVPYFAGPVQLSITPDTSATVALPIAGPAQRDFIYEQIGDAQADGVAMVQLAGYDQDDRQVFVDFEVAVSFGDFVRE